MWTKQVTKISGNDFKKLQQKWYKKLADVGFEDIESHASGPFPMLKVYHSSRFRKVDSEQFFAKQSYFISAGQFLQTYKFSTSSHKRIWKLHCEGKTQSVIAKLCKTNSANVGRLIKFLGAKMQDKVSELITIREGKESDHNFVYATALRGMYYGIPQLSLSPKDTFMACYHAILEKILALPGTYLKIACMKDDPDCVLGYLLGSSKGHIYFAFVKKSWRKLGIATELFRSIQPRPSCAVAVTRIGEKILKKARLQYNPFLLSGDLT